jgi:DNA-binding beta-propeller fold protein YncE
MQQFSPTADPGTWSFTRQFGQRGWGMSDQSGFNWPRDVTYEAGTQTLWVADTKNNRLLPFTATGDPLQGKLITLNASLKGMYWPYAVDAVNGDLIAADTFKNQLESRDPAAPAQPLWVTTTVNGVALKNPYDVAHHGSLLFIADSANKRIVELNADKTDPGVALGTACLHAPQGVAYDAVSGMLWVADTSFNRLEEIDPTTGACVQAVTKFNGADTFNHPGHLEVHQDAGGHSYLYVCDMYNDRVVILDLNEN